MPDVGPVVVQPHVAHQQDLAVLQVAGEGTVLHPARRAPAGPVPVDACCPTLSLQSVAWITELCVSHNQN